jgi:hypothetical protein
MKFELKTENDNYSKLFSYFLGIVSISLLIITFCDVALKFGIISTHYKINFYCKLLSVEKSTTTFKKLSRISSLKSKQKIWEFCREYIK